MEMPVTPAGAQGGPEHRRDRRMRVLKTARIQFNGGFSVFDCRVKNLSPGGAMIDMPSMLGIPTTFDLVIDGTKRHCRVMWRTDRLMGVAFEAPSTGEAA